jgi:hypothetical protein
MENSFQEKIIVKKDFYNSKMNVLRMEELRKLGVITVMVF